MLHEELMDRPTGGLSVLHLEDWSDVVDDGEREYVAEQLLYLRSQILVSGVDYWELIAEAEPGLRLSRL